MPLSWDAHGGDTVVVPGRRPKKRRRKARRAAPSVRSAWSLTWSKVVRLASVEVEALNAGSRAEVSARRQVRDAWRGGFVHARAQSLPARDLEHLVREALASAQKSARKAIGSDVAEGEVEAIVAVLCARVQAAARASASSPEAKVSGILEPLGVPALLTCAYCGGKTSTVTVDHLVPFTGRESSEFSGFGDSPCNRVQCCMRCNTSKFNRPWCSHMVGTIGARLAHTIRAAAESGDEGARAKARKELREWVTGFARIFVQRRLVRPVVSGARLARLNKKLVRLKEKIKEFHCSLHSEVVSVVHTGDEGGSPGFAEDPRAGNSPLSISSSPTDPSVSSFSSSSFSPSSFSSSSASSSSSSSSSSPPSSSSASSSLPSPGCASPFPPPPPWVAALRDPGSFPLSSASPAAATLAASWLEAFPALASKPPSHSLLWRGTLGGVDVASMILDGQCLS